MAADMGTDLFDVRDRTVVITGGLGQLGTEFASTLADRGAKVAVLDASADAMSDEHPLAARVTAGSVAVFAADVRSRSSIESALEAVNARFGVPHGLVNNAALDAPPDAPAEENGPFETYPESSWRQVMDVNVTGVMQVCQIVGGQMAQAGRGSIVNVSSIYGQLSPDQRIYEYQRAGGRDFYKPVAYSVSKSALFNLTRYLSTYWAGHGVRVNTVTFGGVFNHQDERFLAGYEARVPLGRMARPDEYSATIVYLISNASSYMTGSNVVLDGGWSAW